MVNEFCQDIIKKQYHQIYLHGFYGFILDKSRTITLESLQGICLVNELGQDNIVTKFVFLFYASVFDWRIKYIWYPASWIQLWTGTSK